MLWCIRMEFPSPEYLRVVSTIMIISQPEATKAPPLLTGCMHTDRVHIPPHHPLSMKANYWYIQWPNHQELIPSKNEEHNIWIRQRYLTPEGLRFHACLKDLKTKIILYCKIHWFHYDCYFDGNYYAVKIFNPVLWVISSSDFVSKVSVLSFLYVFYVSIFQEICSNLNSIIMYCSIS